MMSIKPHSSRTLLQLLALMSGFQHVHALSQEYCSSENTGSNYSAVYNIYQSNGACQTTCVDEYAFAVVQYQNCWCSNYAPADTVDVSDCDTKCPGYPAESCGNTSDGYYGYIALSKSPSGTAGGSSSAASSTKASSSQQTSTSTSQSSSTQQATSSFFSSSYSSSSSSSSTSSPPTTTRTTSSQRRQNTVYSSISVTVYSTVEQSPSVVVSYVTLSSSSEPSTTSTSSTSTSSTSTTPTSTSSSTTPSSTTSSSETPTVAAVTTTTSDSAAASSTSGTAWTHTTLVSTRVITVAGAPVTQTVTSTPMVVNPNAETQEAERKGVSSGTIAGAVVGSVLGVALLLAGAFFLWRRRRSGSDAGSTTSSARKKMERNTSVLSKTGLLASAGAATDLEKDTYHGPGFINTTAANNSRRQSTMYAAESGGPSPVSPAGDNGSQRARRDSRPLVFDQRLNPAAIMSSWEANGSRASIGTMHDQRDYSRPLGVTNPDPIDD